MKLFLMAGAALALALPVAVHAQDPVPGATEFLDRCAVCHGTTGKGDGIVGELFTQKPKDLTTLSKENGGTFPVERVYQSIDGTHKYPAHGIGDSPMPIWGTYLMAEAIQKQGLTPDLAEAVREGRILALVYYIQSLQQK